MARAFDSTDQLRCSIGGLSGQTLGPSTFAVIINIFTNGTWRAPLVLHTAGGTAQGSLELSPSNTLVFAHAGDDSQSTFTATVADGWVLLAATKAAGTVTPRFHKYVFSTNTWTHSNGDSTLTDGSAPGAGGTVRFGDWQGGDRMLSRLHMAAIFPVELSDAQVESLASGQTQWFAQGPASLWVFDQQNQVTQKVRDLAGTSHETSRTGTSVSALSDWSWTYGASPMCVTRTAVETAVPAADSATWTDSAALTIATVENVSDSAAWSESASVGTTQAGPRIPQLFIEFGFSSPGASTSTYLHLDDPTRGLLDTGTLAPDVVWTDVTPYVSSGSIKRGSSRSDPILKFETGTCTLTLRNEDRRFDPTNLSGPYVSAGVTQVKPMVPVRVRAGWTDDQPGRAAQDASTLPAGDTSVITTAAQAATFQVDDWVALWDETGMRYDTGVPRRITSITDVGGGLSQIEVSAAFPQTAIAGDVLRGCDEVWDLFRGYVDNWDIAWDRGPYWSEATVNASDAFKVLNNQGIAETAGVGAGETTGARINRVLDEVEWPDADRDIAVGDTALAATTFGSDALGELQKSVDAELGELYIDGAGRVYFRNRRATFGDERSATSQALYGDGGGEEIPYTDVEISYDDQQLTNSVTIGRTDGVPQTASDLASIEQYLLRSFERTDLLLQTDTEALTYAQWLLHQRAEPELRFDGLTINPLSNDTLLFPEALGRRFGDRITVRRRPPGGGALIEREVFIHGVEHTFTPASWTTSWTLAAAETLSFLVLDDATLGQLDAGNAIAF